MMINGVKVVASNILTKWVLLGLVSILLRTMIVWLGWDWFTNGESITFIQAIGLSVMITAIAGEHVDTTKMTLNKTACLLITHEIVALIVLFLISLMV